MVKTDQNAKVKWLSFIFWSLFVIWNLLLVISEADAAISKPPSNLGLVGYWSFNEGQGVTTTDSSGNKNKGTLTNGPTWTNGKQGKALSFDGSDDYVTVNDNVTLDINSSFNISCWVKLNALPNSGKWSTCIAKGDNSEEAGLNHNYSLGFDNAVFGTDQAVLVLYENSAGTNFQARWQTSLSLGVWHHLVGVFNDSSDTLTLYVDNVVQATNTSATGIPDTGTSNVYIGQPNTAAVAAGYINGLIDEVRIYNRALSASEVSALYQSGAAKFQAPNNKGLVGYWSFDEGKGVTTTDSSGNKNKGTLTNGPTWTNGKLGKALSFDGSDDYVRVNDSNSLSPNTLTLSAWIRPDSSAIAATLKGIVGKRETEEYQLFLESGKLRLYTWSGVNNDTILGGTTLIANQWAHVVAVVSLNKLELYLNGGSDATPVTRTITIPNTPDPVTIGWDNVNSLRYFSGLIDEVRIYNRALSASEVSALYQSGAVKFQAPNNKGLVGYWSFNEGQGVTSTDFSGNKNNGTLTNMQGNPWVNGKLGKALSFDGSDDYVAPGTFTLSTEYSISAWAYARTISVVGSNDIIALTNSDGTNHGVLIEVGGDGSTRKIRFLHRMPIGVSDGDSFYTASTQFPLNQWVHLTFTRDSSKVQRIYINGALDTSNNGTANDFGSTTLRPFIGRLFITSSARSWDGLIDEVRIYNRALSAAEVQALYNAGR